MSSIWTNLPGMPVKTSATWNGWRQEALDLARALDGQLILFGQLVHAEDGDDVLQRLVALERRLHRARGLVMLLADGARLEHAAGRIERIDGRVDAQLGDRAVQRRRRVQVGERGRRRRIGQIVRGDVDRLHRGDRALVGRGDPLLQRAHVGRQRRLIAHRRRDAAEQRRHFRARLGEAEDVVDEEQHVLPFDIAEIFGDRQAATARRGRARPAARSSGRTPARPSTPRGVALPSASLAMTPASRNSW